MSLCATPRGAVHNMQSADGSVCVGVLFASGWCVEEIKEYECNVSALSSEGRESVSDMNSHG